MIQLNYRDTRPFYQQIKDNVRQLGGQRCFEKR